MSGLLPFRHTFFAHNLTSAVASILPVRQLRVGLIDVLDSRKDTDLFCPYLTPATGPGGHVEHFLNWAFHLHPWQLFKYTIPVSYISNVYTEDDIDVVGEVHFTLKLAQPAPILMWFARGYDSKKHQIEQWTSGLEVVCEQWLDVTNYLVDWQDFASLEHEITGGEELAAILKRVLPSHLQADLEVGITEVEVLDEQNVQKAKRVLV